MVIKDRAWYKADIKKNQRRMAKNAIRSMSKGAEKNVLKRLGKKWSAAELKTMRGELDAESPHVRRMRMPAGSAAMSSWQDRWAAGPLNKTFQSNTYGGGIWRDGGDVFYNKGQGRWIWDWRSSSWKKV